MIVVCFGFYVAESLVSILYTFKFMLFKTRKKPELWSVLLPKDLLKYHKISRTYKKKSFSSEIDLLAKDVEKKTPNEFLPSLFSLSTK